MLAAFSPPVTSRSLVHRLVYPGQRSARKWNSNDATKRPTSIQNASTRNELSFEALGIRSSLATAVRAAFPNVQRPTEMQAEFIPAVLHGKDVLLTDSTGTGK
jgi:superfamily II DNA/RNA helicase